MHHMFDEPPTVAPVVHDKRITATVSHAIYNTHVGMLNPDKAPEYASVDLSQYRQRGYKVGSLMTGPEDPDLYYRQPGHPLSPLAKKGGRHQPEDDGPFDNGETKKGRYTEHL